MRANNSTHTDAGRKKGYKGTGWRGKSHKTVVNLKGRIAHTGLWEHESDK